jgi:hypothetical protein
MSYYKNFQTKNKHKNIKTEYKGGAFDSKKEAQFCMWLDQEVKAKRIKIYDKQVRFDLYGENKTKICFYKADFVVMHNDGMTEIIDVKSAWTAKLPVFRMKWKLLEDKYKEEIKRGLIKLTLQY